MHGAPLGGPWPIGGGIATGNDDLLIFYGERRQSGPHVERARRLSQCDSYKKNVAADVGGSQPASSELKRATPVAE